MSTLKFLHVLFLLLFLLQFHPSHSLAPLSTVRIGAQFPLYKTKTAGYTEDSGGRRRQAAFLLALRHINDKDDGFFDDILPNTMVRFQ